MNMTSLQFSIVGTYSLIIILVLIAIPIVLLRPKSVPFFTDLKRSLSLDPNTDANFTKQFGVVSAGDFKKEFRQNLAIFLTTGSIAVAFLTAGFSLISAFIAFISAMSLTPILHSSIERVSSFRKVAPDHIYAWCHDIAVYLDIPKPHRSMTVLDSVVYFSLHFEHADHFKASHTPVSKLPTN